MSSASSGTDGMSHTKQCELCQSAPWQVSSASSRIDGMSHTKQCELCQYFQLSSSQFSRGLTLCQGRHVLQESCTTALARPKKVAPAGRKLGLIHWILISCIVWSITQASLPPLCQILLWCTVIFVVFLVLHLGYEIICELVTQALATWII